MYTEMKRLFLLPIFLFCMMIPVFGQQYTVISITGKVTAVKDDSNRELKLREKLSPQSVINIPYNSKVELLDERGSKKYTLKTPGQGSITNMMKDRNNAVMKLTGQYLSYIKARVKGNGELTSRRYSDPATVTREVAVASQSFDEQYIAFHVHIDQSHKVIIQSGRVASSIAAHYSSSKRRMQLRASLMLGSCWSPPTMAPSLLNVAWHM